MSLIHTSSLPDVDIPEMSITDYVFHKASAYPDRIAISDGAGNQYTFAELEQASRSLAGGLAARGMGPGTCIALMAPNLPQFPVVFHGVATAGATLTTINPTYGAAEVRHQLQDAGATMLITIGMFLEVAQEAVEGTDVTEVVTI
ncbi:MAG: AMP-binding protein, partial [Actinomycetota bacterium]|nr:AMP-binding protein [Actinomycetota bacterium]